MIQVTSQRAFRLETKVGFVLVSMQLWVRLSIREKRNPPAPTRNGEADCSPPGALSYSVRVSEAPPVEEYPVVAPEPQLFPRALELGSKAVLQGNTCTKSTAHTHTRTSAYLQRQGNAKLTASEYWAPPLLTLTALHNAGFCSQQGWLLLWVLVSVFLFCFFNLVITILASYN